MRRGIYGNDRLQSAVGLADQISVFYLIDHMETLRQIQFPLGLQLQDVFDVVVFAVVVAVDISGPICVIFALVVGIDAVSLGIDLSVKIPLVTVILAAVDVPAFQNITDALRDGAVHVRVADLFVIVEAEGQRLIVGKVILALGRIGIKHDAAALILPLRVKSQRAVRHGQRLGVRIVGERHHLAGGIKAPAEENIAVQSVVRGLILAPVGTVFAQIRAEGDVRNRFVPRRFDIAIRHEVDVVLVAHEVNIYFSRRFRVAFAADLMHARDRNVADVFIRSISGADKRGEAEFGMEHPGIRYRSVTVSGVGDSLGHSRLSLERGDVDIELYRSVCFSSPVEEEISVSAVARVVRVRIIETGERLIHLGGNAGDRTRAIGIGAGPPRPGKRHKVIPRHVVFSVVVSRKICLRDQLLCDLFVAADSGPYLGDLKAVGDLDFNVVVRYILPSRRDRHRGGILVRARQDPGICIRVALALELERKLLMILKRAYIVSVKQVKGGVVSGDRFPRDVSGRVAVIVVYRTRRRSRPGQHGVDAV